MKKENFDLPPKIYGDHSIVDRWIKSYNNNREKNMGIVLSGLKGTGKTITAQMLCLKLELPVILINNDWSGVGFIDYITNPQLGKCIVFIDEFEKIYYDKAKQKDLLSIMDGNFRTELLFLLTVNEYKLNEYLINRLNRIKYRKSYDNLEESVILDVINDLLINKEHTDSILDCFDRLGICTFDLLVNIIKEVNLFNESAIECAKHLNLQTESSYYRVSEVDHNGTENFCSYKYFDYYDDDILEVRRDSMEYINNKVKLFASKFKNNTEAFIKYNEGNSSTELTPIKEQTQPVLSTRLSSEDECQKDCEVSAQPISCQDFDIDIGYPYEDTGSYLNLHLNKCIVEKINRNEIHIYPSKEMKQSYQYIKLERSVPLYKKAF